MRGSMMPGVLLPGLNAKLSGSVASEVALLGALLLLMETGET
jgi:hypothetical protein